MCVFSWQLAAIVNMPRKAARLILSVDSWYVAILNYAA